jgi:hypothetical protein
MFCTDSNDLYTLYSLWGIVATVMAASTNFAGIAICRFFLGLFEAGTVYLLHTRVLANFLNRFLSWCHLFHVFMVYKKRIRSSYWFFLVIQ